MKYKSSETKRAYRSRRDDIRLIKPAYSRQPYRLGRELGGSNRPHKKEELMGVLGDSQYSRQVKLDFLRGYLSVQ